MPAIARFIAVAALLFFADALGAGRNARAQEAEPPTAAAPSGRPSECAPNWELDEGVCYPACPQGYGGGGAVCRQDCPAGYGDEGDICRSDTGVIYKASQARGPGQLTRSAYRDLFANFVGLYRAGAALLAAPLREDERAYLAQFFPARLVDQVRLTVVPAITLPFLLDVSATTIGNDLIVVKDGRRSNALLKHELVHVCQADKLGLDAFMREYADQYVDAGYQYADIPFERQAYAFDAVTGPVAAHLGYCE